MNIIVNTSNEYNLALQENEVTKSILQNVSVLLNTKKGTIPMYREFGLPMAFVDMPIDTAETMATLEISDALEEFEPRAELVDLQFTKSKDGKMALKVEVALNEGD